MSQTKAQLLGPVLGNVNYDSGTLFVDSANNRVGIGTTSPSSNLEILRSADPIVSNGALISLKHHTTNSQFPYVGINLDHYNAGAGNQGGAFIQVSNNGTQEAVIQYDDDIGVNNGLLIKNNTDGPIYFQTNGANERLRISSTGNVGIGTTNPQSTLHIVGNQYLAGGNYFTQTTSGYFWADSGSYAAGIFGGAAGLTTIRSSANIVIETGGTGEKVCITSGGNVGIGTISPYSRLGLRGDITLGLSPAPNGSYGKLSWRYNNSGSFGASAYIDVIQVSAGNSGHMIFATNNNSPDTAEASERVRITSSGNVGIGTTNPSDKLTIWAAPNSLFFGGKDTTRGNNVFQLLADDAPGNGELRLYRNSASDTHEKTVEIASHGNSYFTGGNVGIGVTNPTTALDIRGSTESAVTVGTTSQLYGRLYGSSTLTFIGSYNGADLSFSTNSSTSYNSKMMIKNGGNVGIGTTDPSYKFHVQTTGNNNAIAVVGLQNDTDQALFIPRGAINFDSAGTAHIRNSGTTTSELRLSSRGTASGITFYHGGVGDVTNSGTISAGIHQSGGVGKFAVGVAYNATYPASIIAREGVISPLIYWPRDYATAAGSIGYDELAVGGRINLKPAGEPGSLNTFLHGTFGIGYGTASEDISWNRFRVLFRLTRHTLSYNSDQITMGLQRYFYSSGWSDIPNSTWIFSGTDSERGSRWTASRWISYSDWTGGEDVPGFGIKYHSSAPSGTASSMRIGAVYIQYAYFS